MSYPKIDFLYLSEPDMLKAGVDDVVACTDCMEDLLKLLDKGDYRMGGENGNSHGCMVTFPDEPQFPGMPKNGPDRRFMAMPAYVGGPFQVAGEKWYGSNTANREKGIPRSILMVMLNNKDTGEPLALMSGNLISAYRTAAIPGVGVKHLAREDAKVLGIVGPGVINRATIETFAALRPSLEILKIKGRGQASIDRCIEYVNKKMPGRFKDIIVCDTLEECVRDSDIVSFCTSITGGDPANYPHVETEWIKPGALFTCPMAGDFSDDIIEDPNTKLVVDNSGLYEAWAEEYPYPTYNTIAIPGSKFTDMIHDGKIEASRIEDLGGILNGRFPGRKDDKQVIIYSIGGMPIEDVAWGKVLYDRAVEKGIGVKLNLWDSPYFY